LPGLGTKARIATDILLFFSVSFFFFILIFAVKRHQNCEDQASAELRLIFPQKLADFEKPEYPGEIKEKINKMKLLKDML
jgi:hypothetical protein